MALDVKSDNIPTMIEQNDPSTINAKTSFAPVRPRTDGDSSEQPLPNYYYSNPDPTEHQHTYSEQAATDRAIKRFWTAFVFAAAAFFAFNLLLRASIELALIGRGHRGWVSYYTFVFFLLVESNRL